MKNICLSLSVIAAVVFSGCSKNKSASNTSSVMFVNGCGSASSIVAKVNGNTVNNSGNLQFTYGSGYQNVAADANLNIAFYLVYGGPLITNGVINFSPNTHYSVFAGGLITKPSLVVTTDYLVTPSTGNASVRFINLSADSLNENFSIGTQQLDSNITYTSCSPFFEIPATTSIGVSVVDPAYTEPVYIAQLSNQHFDAGKIYTIMLTGTHTATAGSTASLLLTVIKNN